MTNILNLVPNTNGTYALDDVHQVDSNFVFDTLVSCKGHLQLTKELLAKEYGRDAVTDTIILDAIKDRLPELKQYMEAMAILDLFSLMPRLQKSLEGVLTSLQDPDTIIAAYMDMHKLISTKVDTQKIDVTHRDEIIWRNVPVELRQLWLSDDEDAN